MTIDEIIAQEKELSEHYKRRFDNMNEVEKLSNKLLKDEIEYHEQIAEWLEELKAIKSSDIPIIHGKEKLELHDNAIRNKAIDDLMEKAREGLIFDEDWDYLLQESEKLKTDRENELK